MIAYLSGIRKSYDPGYRFETELNSDCRISDFKMLGDMSGHIKNDYF